MKLTGTARGRNMQDLTQDAHRQAQLFYGDDNYNLASRSPRAIAEYIEFVDGRSEPTTTTFEMDFMAESPATIKDERLSP